MLKPSRFLFLLISVLVLLCPPMPILLFSQTTDQSSGLARRGITHRFLEQDLIELRDECSGQPMVRSLNEPSPEQICAWADTEGIPILEIDPTQIDTTQYFGYYILWAEVPLSNSYGSPIVVSDVNQNGHPDFYGVFKDFGTDFQARVYELDTNGVATVVYTYEPRPGIARLLVDADRDSLREVIFDLGGNVSDFEQMFVGDLPISLNFAHDMYYNNYQPGFTGIYVGDLDGDSLTDFLYKGSEFDSLVGATTKIYVAEYSPDSNNFVRVWSTTFVPVSQSGVGGFSVGDFDQDGNTEFVCSESTTGQIFVVENQGDNEFAQVWRDTVPFVNLYYHGCGDVDHDGKEEFFVGATMSTGDWTLCYEADSNNSYSAKFLIKMPAGGLVGGLMYSTSDLNSDGHLELLISGGADLYAFCSDMDDLYQLWYFKPSSVTKGFQTYRFWGDNINSILISRDTLDALGRSRDYTQVFRPGLVLGAEQALDTPSIPRDFELGQNYPNPFNPITVIKYELPVGSHVSLKVYDVLGREVMTMIDEVRQAGHHEVIFDGRNLATGMYFYRLAAGRFADVKRLLLTK